MGGGEAYKQNKLIIVSSTFIQLIPHRLIVKQFHLQKWEKNPGMDM